MSKRSEYGELENLPACAAEYIRLVIKKMRYRRKVGREVGAELAGHFEDALRDYQTAEERERKAKELIEEFGDTKLLAILLRRAKKRCRPMWRTAVVRTFQAAGVLILSLVLYMGWFLSGRPRITTDYVAELNRIVRPVADESLNAAPLYEKATKLYEEKADSNMTKLLEKKYSEVTAEEREIIAGWVAANKGIFDLVEAGNQKPYHWQKYEPTTTGMFGLLMPNLGGLRKLAKTLRWQVWLSSEQGQFEEAFGDIKRMYHIGQQLKGDKTLIEQLVGIAIEAMAAGTVRDVLSTYNGGASELAGLQKDFEQMVAGENFVPSMKTERLFVYDEIQRCFTADGIGGGHLYLQRVAAVGQWDKDIDSSLVMLGLIGVPKNWPMAAKVLFTHPDKEQTRSTAERYYRFWEEMAKKTPAQLRAEGVDLAEPGWEIVKGNVLLEMLSPALGKVCELGHRIKCDVEATVAIIGVLRYKADKGSYPEDLAQLVAAGYVKNLPMDPYTDKALVYKKTEGSFTLYSVGHNFEDDGGKVYRDSKGRFQLWGEEGDTVFWPVEE